MGSTDKDLEGQLKEAGSKLVDPPKSVEELLRILDQVESYLVKVEQSPSSSMQEALAPSVNALIDEKLLRHSDLDVKVAVASCISEITRITAPDAPYDDDRMKEVFQLIVSSFENLSDLSSQSFMKRTSILETVAKVRSCVVMLDLECDALIIEMFQHFLNSIRDHHPQNVLASMETIMTLVLEESEDIPPEFLSPILECLRKDNKVLPIARKLGERILESCAGKIRQYLSHAVHTLGLSMENYGEIVASICQEARDSVGQNDVSAADPVMDESNNERPSLQEAENGNQDEEETAKDSMTPIGSVQAGEGNQLAESNSLKKLEDHDLSDRIAGNTVPKNDDPDNLDGRTTEDPEKTLEECAMEREKKSSSSRSAASSDRPRLDYEAESEKPVDSKVDVKDVSSLPLQESSVAAVVEVSNKDDGVNISPGKAENGESEVIAPTLHRENPTDENPTETCLAENKEDSGKEAVEATRKISDQSSDSEMKPNMTSVKNAPYDSSDDIKTPNVPLPSKKGSAKTKSELKKQASVEVDVGSKTGFVSSKSLGLKKQSRSIITTEKCASKSSGKEDNKVPSLSSTKSTKLAQLTGDAPKTNLKRKHPSGNGKESKAKELGEEIVGSKIRVWWPDDKMFYKGVVDSFDPAKKKHKIAYVDGDIEILNLTKEKYQLLGEDSNSDKGEETDRPTTDASSDLPLKKKGKVTVAPESKVQMDSSSKSAGGTAGKSKGVSSKASGKSEESKSATKSKDNFEDKSKDQASTSVSGSKSKGPPDASKPSKLKDGGISTPSLSAKSKQETPRTGKTKETLTAASMSKGKSTTKSGGKSDANGIGNMKANLSQKREREVMNESTKSNAKGKSPSASKVKTGTRKKRRGS